MAGGEQCVIGLRSQGPGASDQGRFAVERRKTAEAALERAHDKLRDVTADSLGSVDNAGCGGRWAEPVDGLATLRLMEAALQHFRELGGEAPCFISLLICRCQHQGCVRSCLRGDPHGGRGSQGRWGSTVGQDGATPSSPQVSALSGSSVSCRPTSGRTRIGAADLPGLRPRRLW
jgi:hypothetical protein